MRKDRSGVVLIAQRARREVVRVNRNAHGMLRCAPDVYCDLQDTLYYDGALGTNQVVAGLLRVCALLRSVVQMQRGSGRAPIVVGQMHLKR
jgi:hypothetical protein